jgi:hypothetical protein
MLTRRRRSERRSRGRQNARAAPTASKRVNKWTQKVTRSSNALDLDPKVFTRRSPKAVAASLKRSALRSRRRKAAPYQSAMSMLNFYINRAGSGLTAPQKAVLERAKGELRKAFGRGRPHRTSRSRS